MIVELESFEPQNARGFIVIEGVNGAGKSTVINAVSKALTDQNLAYFKTFEPGDTPLGKELRKLLLNSPQIPRTAHSEVFLFAADRNEHVRAAILPALSRGEVVISDRYLYSTIAFQGYGRELDLNLIEQVNELAVSGNYPDLVILLDLDPEEGLRRTQVRNESSGESDSFELEHLEFHRRIRNGFLSLAKSRPEPFLVIDASDSPSSVAAKAIDAVLKVAAQRGARGIK